MKVSIEVDFSDVDKKLLEAAAAAASEHHTLKINIREWDEYMKAEAFLRRLKLIAGPDENLQVTDAGREVLAQINAPESL